LHRQIALSLHAAEALRGRPSFWDFTDDAKEYEQLIHSMSHFMKRLGDLLGSFSAGYYSFIVVAVYSYTSFGGNTFTFMYPSYDVVVKVNLALAMMLIVSTAIPCVLELALFNNRSREQHFLTSVVQKMKLNDRMVNTNRDEVYRGEQGAVVSQSTYGRLVGQPEPRASSFRYILSVPFFCYVVALGATFTEISVVQQRSANDLSVVTASDVTKLHVATIVRVAVLLIGWFSSLTAF
jgi:hypothetical protein